MQNNITEIPTKIMTNTDPYNPGPQLNATVTSTVTGIDALNRHALY